MLQQQRPPMSELDSLRRIGSLALNRLRNTWFCLCGTKSASTKLKVIKKCRGNQEMSKTEGIEVKGNHIILRKDCLSVPPRHQRSEQDDVFPNIKMGPEQNVKWAAICLCAVKPDALRFLLGPFCQTYGDRGTWCESSPPSLLHRSHKRRLTQGDGSAPIHCVCGLGLGSPWGLTPTWQNSHMSGVQDKRWQVWQPSIGGNDTCNPYWYKIYYCIF